MPKYHAKRAAAPARRVHLAKIVRQVHLGKIGGVVVPAVAAMTLVAGLSMALPVATESVKAEPVAATQDLAQREERANRSTERTPASPKAKQSPKSSPEAKKKSEPAALTAKVAKAVGKRYATTELNLRVEAKNDAEVSGVLDEGDKVDITGETSGDFAQVLIDKKVFWVSAKYLSEEEPKTADVDAPCASGSAVENGLQPNTIKVHRAVCHNFPQITTYGGVRADPYPEHPSGRALDVMVSDNATGWEIARFVRDNASTLGVTQVIWDQQIWTTERSGEGWRPMEDRGGATANHRDHVHVSTSY